MGFYVTLSSDGLAIKAGHDADVLRHLQAWSRKMVESHPTAIVAIARAKTPADAIELGNAARTGDRDDDNDEEPTAELDFE